ncbi:MAG: sugar nucleotide-binding protein, partial [Bacillota bacterium]
MPALKKVLITGGGGFLGQYLNIEFSKQFEVLSVYHNNSGNAGEYKSVSVDITDKDKMKLLFETFRPEVVIHTASVSNNELAAKMSFQRVIDINVNATEHIAELSGKYNSRLFYTSTDLVYDGSQGAMLKETSELNPVSLYAQTKLEGEKRIKDV